MDVRSLERSGDVAALRGGGELLLIGPWTVFQGVSQSLIIRDPSRLRTVLYPHLRDDSSLAKLAALYRRLICTGSVGGHYSPQQTVEQMMALMQIGQIVAVALPDTSGNDGNGNVQPAMLSGNPTGPVAQWSLADRFSYVLNKSPHYMPAALGNELRNALSGRSLAIIVGVLVVWAGSHAIGVGLVADAALLAIGFTLAGWAIFDGIKYLIQFFNLTTDASSTDDLDRAAEQFAKGVIAMGVGAVIALLTRGANRLAPRPVSRSMPRPSAETPYTPRQASASTASSAEARAPNPVTSDGTANAATAPRLSDDLAATMNKPDVTDPELRGLMDRVYRNGAQVGTGSTADAVRFERLTGERVGGVLHTQKAMDSSTALQKWLNSHPDASFGDRSAAEHVLQDLQNALDGR